MRSPTTSGRICRRAGLFTALAAVRRSPCRLLPVRQQPRRPFPPPPGQSQPSRNQHAGAEPQHRPDGGELDVHHDLLADRHCSLSALSVGSCVTVSGQHPKKGSTAINATSVSISSASSTGTCTAGSAEPAQAASAASAGWVGRRDSTVLRGGEPERHISAPLPDRGFANFAFASGKVTAMSGSTITVVALHRPSGRARPSRQSRPRSQRRPRRPPSRSRRHRRPPTPRRSRPLHRHWRWGLRERHRALRNQRQFYRSTVRITGTSGSTCSTGGFRGGAGFG